MYRHHIISAPTWGKSRQVDIRQTRSVVRRQVGRLPGGNHTGRRGRLTDKQAGNQARRQETGKQIGRHADRKADKRT